MPVTRSSGPPTAASLQPFLMEAFENFKQKHSKQNQDLIHKNRLLLKSTAELERMMKELKNENIELRIQIQKSNSLAQYWRQRAESSAGQYNFNPDQVRLAVLDIANRCKTLESSLAHLQPSSSNSNTDSTPFFNPIPPAPPTANCLSSLPTDRNRAELIALRERRRSQLAVEPEESRLSFINECSGIEDRSESTLPLELSQAQTAHPNLLPKGSSSNHPPNQASRFAPGPSNHLLISSGHQNVAPRSKLRQELMAPFPKSSQPLQNSTGSSSSTMDNILEANDQKTSSQDRPDGGVKNPSEGRSQKGHACDDENESLIDELNTGSFSVPNRAMSQLNQSSSSNSSDSDDEADENIGTSDQLRTQNAPQQEHRSSILSQRRSKKQRRTSLVPQNVLETVSPAAFSLNSSTCPPASMAMERDLESTEHTDEPVPSNLSKTALDPILVSQSSSSKRRDSGLTKVETEKEDGESAEQSSTQDEGWEKRPVGKKKRPRTELDAVSEEHPSHEGTDVGDQPPSNSTSAGPREARRARKEVNYALPSLNKKMRRPASQGPTTGSRKSSVSSSKNMNHLSTNAAAVNKKPQSNSSCKSSGATPSTVQSNTSCSSVANNTTLTTGSSPLSSSRSTLSSVSSSSSQLASVLISNNKSSSTKSEQKENMIDTNQQKQSNRKPGAVMESTGDEKKLSVVENRSTRNLSSSKSKKDKSELPTGVNAQIEEALEDVPVHVRGVRRVTLENLAQRAEQRNKENGGKSNCKKNSSSLSSTSSTTTKKEDVHDKNNNSSSSTSTTSKVKNIPHDNDDDDNLKDVQIDLLGMRRMTRQITAGVETDKLAASLSDEGRQILLNHSRRRTHS